jgi:hypothetical protein
MSRDVKDFLKVLEEGMGKPTNKRESLELMACKGEYPCDKCALCTNPETCAVKTCAPWYLWFRCHWQNIKKAAVNK